MAERRMMSKKVVTQAELKSILHYDQESGTFIWKVTTGRASLGGVAGVLRNDGYTSIKIGGRHYMAHRLAFLYVTGKFPKNEIDHINHIRQDNRIINLREVTHIQNMKNKCLSTNNTSSIVGVSFHSRDRKWQALIKVSSKLIHLGTYDYKFQAIMARKNAEIKYAFHKNHGKKKEASNAL